MYQKIVLVILPVRHFILSERYISHHHVKKVIGITGILKACDFNVRMRVKLFCDAPGNPVKLRPVEPAPRHFLRQTAIEIPNACGGI